MLLTLLLTLPVNCSRKRKEHVRWSPPLLHYLQRALRKIWGVLQECERKLVSISLQRLQNMMHVRLALHVLILRDKWAANKYNLCYSSFH